MKPEFTPGPWRVITPLIHVANETQTYTVDGPDSDFMYLANIEDAHLIAAAPDLYDALTDVALQLQMIKSFIVEGAPGWEGIRAAMLACEEETVLDAAITALDAAWKAQCKARGEATQ